MNYENEIQKVSSAIEALKALKREIIATKKKSEKAFNSQTQKASVDLNWQCMVLAKQRKATYKAILDADLRVNLGTTEYSPSAFHRFKDE